MRTVLPLRPLSSQGGQDFTVMDGVAARVEEIKGKKADRERQCMDSLQTERR